MAASAGDACRGARRRAVGQDGTVGQDGRGGSEPAGGAGPWSRVDCGALAGRSGGKRRLEAQPARLHRGARSRMPFCRGRRHAGEDRPKRGAGLALRVPSCSVGAKEEIRSVSVPAAQIAAAPQTTTDPNSTPDVPNMAGKARGGSDRVAPGPGVLDPRARRSTCASARSQRSLCRGDSTSTAPAWPP